MRIFRKNFVGGFTLIELLVVISIIAILTAVATVSYVNVQKKARDNVRKSNLAQVQQALAVFYANNGAYPDEPPNDHMSCSTTVSTDSERDNPLGGKIHWGELFACPVSSPTKTYLAKLPLDPIGTCWNKPAEAETSGCNAADSGNHRDGYIYEVRQTCPSNGVSNGVACTANGGWCNNTEGGRCQKYALWARLENPNDPDRWVEYKDDMCDEIAHSGDDADSMDNRWAGGSTITPGNYWSSATWYCVHSP